MVIPAADAHGIPELAPAQVIEACKRPRSPQGTLDSLRVPAFAAGSAITSLKQGDRDQHDHEEQ